MSLKVKSGYLDEKWEAWIDKKKVAESGSWSTSTILFKDPHKVSLEKNHELVAQLMSDGWVTQTTDDSGCVTMMRQI